MAQQTSLRDVVLASTSAYQDAASVCTSKLERLWRDVGRSEDEQLHLLQLVVKAASDVWHTAVEKAEDTRSQLLAQVEEIWREVWLLQQQLGLLEPGAMQEHNVMVTPGMTVLGALEHAKGQLAKWRAQKVERQKEYEAVQSSIAVLRQQLGQPHSVAKPDFTKAGMDFLCLEKDRLLSELDRQMVVLHAEMQRLQVICEVLGEDVSRMAAEVHPSLRHYRFADGAEQAACVDGCADLSPATMEGLGAKIHALHALKVEREAQLQAQEDVLCSLWDALHVSPAAPERAVFAAAMSGPNRLHTSSMDQVLAEVRRLEACRAQAMRDLTLAKARELQAVCQSSHMPAPSLEAVLADLGRKPPATPPHDGSSAGPAASSTPGQISDVLSRVCRLLAEVSQEAARRRPVVAAIQDLEAALEEVRWLVDTWEASGQANYKMRDYNQQLNRSLKAVQKRERLPAMATRLQQVLSDWQLTEGTPFLWDGRDYLPELEHVLQVCQQQADAERERSSQRAASKQQAGALTSRHTHGSSSAGGARPHTPLAGKPPPAGGARAGNGMGAAMAAVTPQMLKKGVSVQLAVPKTAAPMVSQRRLSSAGANSFSSSMQLTPADVTGTSTARTPPRQGAAGALTPPSAVRGQPQLTPTSSAKRSHSTSGQARADVTPAPPRCVTPDVGIRSDIHDVQALPDDMASAKRLLPATASQTSLDADDNRLADQSRSEACLPTPPPSTQRGSRIPRFSIG